jgi:NADH:ubiquinone oxidoreductase subunit 4 (subunit M)
VNEGFLEAFMERAVARPFARLAKWAHRASKLWGASQTLAPASATLKSVVWFPAFVLALYGVNLIFGPGSFVPLSFLMAAVFLSLSAFAEDNSPIRSLKLACFSHLCVVIGLFVNHEHARGAATLYAVGFFVSWFLAHDAYTYVFSKRMFQNRARFNGLFAQFPIASMLCFLGVLGLVGFPIATTFYAEDILFEHAVEVGVVFIGVMSLIFVVNGITLMRMFSRCFFGSRDAEGSELSLDFSSLRAFAMVGVFILANALGFILI